MSKSKTRKPRTFGMHKKQAKKNPTVVPYAEDPKDYYIQIVYKSGLATIKVTYSIEPETGDFTEVNVKESNCKLEPFQAVQFARLKGQPVKGWSSTSSTNIPPEVLEDMNTKALQRELDKAKAEKPKRKYTKKGAESKNATVAES